LQLVHRNCHKEKTIQQRDRRRKHHQIQLRSR
jgi:hypothetical protein